MLRVGHPTSWGGRQTPPQGRREGRTSTASRCRCSATVAEANGRDGAPDVNRGVSSRRSSPRDGRDRGDRRRHPASGVIITEGIPVHEQCRVSGRTRRESRPASSARTVPGLNQPPASRTPASSRADIAKPRATSGLVSKSGTLTYQNDVRACADIGFLHGDRHRRRPRSSGTTAHRPRSRRSRPNPDHRGDRDDR